MSVANLIAKRHLWGSLANDLVRMEMPTPSKDTAVSLDDVYKTYGLTAGDLSELIAREDFQKFLAREKAQAAELGRQAPHALMTGELAADLAVEIYKAAKRPDVSLADKVKAYVALARSAGLDEAPRERPAVNVNVGLGVQMNVPVLNNPKLDHVPGVLEARPEPRRLN